MKQTQCEKIVEYMRKYGSITQMQAYIDVGCWRLASRISDLKRQGYAIRTERIKVKNRDGGFTPIARYSLAEVGNADNRVQSIRE